MYLIYLFISLLAAGTKLLWCCFVLHSGTLSRRSWNSVHLESCWGRKHNRITPEQKALNPNNCSRADFCTRSPIFTLTSMCVFLKEEKVKMYPNQSSFMHLYLYKWQMKVSVFIHRLHNTLQIRNAERTGVKYKTILPMLCSQGLLAKSVLQQRWAENVAEKILTLILKNMGKKTLNILWNRMHGN